MTGSATSISSLGFMVSYSFGLFSEKRLIAHLTGDFFR